MQENMTINKSIQEDREIKIEEVKEKIKNILKKAGQEKDDELLINPIVESLGLLKNSETEKILKELKNTATEEEKTVIQKVINAINTAKNIILEIRQKPLLIKAGKTTTETVISDILKSFQLDGPAFQKLRMLIDQEPRRNELGDILKKLLIEKLKGFELPDESLKIYGYSPKDAMIYLYEVKKLSIDQATEIVDTIWPENKKKEVLNSEKKETEAEKNKRREMEILLEKARNVLSTNTIIFLKIDGMANEEERKRQIEKAINDIKDMIRQLKKFFDLEENKQYHCVENNTKEYKSQIMGLEDLYQELEKKI